MALTDFTNNAEDFGPRAEVWGWFGSPVRR